MVAYINQNEDIWTFARLVNPQQIPIVQSDVSSIECAVYDLSSATPWTAVATPAIIVSQAVFDTLFVDYGWSQDDIGYNFRHRIQPSTLATKGGHSYKIEYKLSSNGPQDWQTLTIAKIVTIAPVQIA